MNILVSANYYPEKIGGIELVTQNLIKHFRAGGHQVRWIAADVADRKRTPQKDDVPIPAWNFTESKLGFPYPIPDPFTLWSTREHVKWCDVVYLHDCLYLHNQFLSRTARKMGRPIVTTQHVGLVPYSQGYKKTLQQISYKTIGKRLLEGSDQVVFVSGVVKSWFDDFIKFRRPAQVIPNGVDTSIFHAFPIEEQQKVRSELGIPLGSRVCIFVGRFTQKKGLHLIREVAGSIPDWSWILVGTVAEENPAAWGFPNVRVLPPTKQSELGRLYAAADLAVLPSVGEGFPLVVAESMASGTPILVCSETSQAVPGLSDVVAITEPVADDLKKSIDELMRNPEMLGSLKLQGQNFATRKLDWSAIAGEYLNIFSSVARS